MAQGSKIPFSGVLLVVFGALFLANQMGAIQFHGVFAMWWPAILILAGLLNLLERPASALGPLVMLTVGVALQLSNLHVVKFESVWKLWPVILIIAGLNILFSHRSKA